MEIQKELSQISWLVDEPTYRQDPALSYSNLSTFETLGFTGLDHLFDKKESPSLLVGSCIDCILTGGEDEFNTLYCVANIPALGDKPLQIADYLFANYGGLYSSLTEMPVTYILNAANVFEYQKRWRDDNRAKDLTEKCNPYYMAKVHSAGKTIVDCQTFEDVKACVRALRESPATCGYFADNDELSPIRRYYQLKFKFSHDGVDYRSMMDLIVVDYEKRKVYPIDLKSSLSCPEWEFEENFKKWHYYVQARLYWRNLRANMDADDYFKDFTLEDYRFIIVNPKTLTPLVWEFPLTKSIGTLVTDTGYEVKDPFEIGKELRGYLDCRPPVPNGINKDGVNMINCLTIK